MSDFKLQKKKSGSSQKHKLKEMNRRAIIRLKTLSKRQQHLLLKVLMPETVKQVTSRSRVAIKIEGEGLTIQVEARDTSALRATLNSYLRWIVMIKDLCRITADLTTHPKKLN